MKRVFDIFCGSLGIIPPSPVFLTVILLIFLEDKMGYLFILKELGKEEENV